MGMPDLLNCALMAINDECPPERGLYLCQLEDTGECDCRRCWQTYLIYVANGRRYDPYGNKREAR